MTTPTQDLKHSEGFWGLASHEKNRSNSKNPFKSPFVGYGKQSSQGLPFQSPFANNRFQAHLEKENLKIFQERTPQNQTKWRMIDETPELTMAQTHGLGRLDEMEATPDVFSKNKGSLMGDLLGSGTHEGLELDVEDDQRLLILSGHKFFGDLDTPNVRAEHNVFTGIVNHNKLSENDAQSKLINDSNRGLIVHNNNCISLRSTGNFTSQSGFYQGANNQATNNNIKNIQNRNQVSGMTIANSEGTMVMNQNQILRNKRGRSSIHNANHIRRTLWPLKEIPNREDDFRGLFSDQNLKNRGAAFGSKLLDFGGEQFNKTDSAQAHVNSNNPQNIRGATQGNLVHKEMARRGQATGFYPNINNNKVFNSKNCHNNNITKHAIFQHQGLGDIQEVAEEEDFFNEERVTEKGDIKIKQSGEIVSNQNNSKLLLNQDQNSSNLFQTNEITTSEQVSNKFENGNIRIYSEETINPNPNEIKKASNNHPILHNDHVGGITHSGNLPRTRFGSLSLNKSQSQGQHQNNLQPTRPRSNTNTHTAHTNNLTAPNPPNSKNMRALPEIDDPSQMLDQCQHFFDNSLQRILDSVEGKNSIYQSDNQSVVDLIIETKLNLERSKSNTPKGSFTDQRITRFLMSNEKTKNAGSVYFGSGDKRRSSARELLRQTELSRTDRKRKGSQSYTNLFEHKVEELKSEDAQAAKLSSQREHAKIEIPTQPNRRGKDTSSEENTSQREDINSKHFRYAVTLSGNKNNHEASKRVSHNVTKWANSPIFNQGGHSGATPNQRLGLDEAVRLMQQSSIQSNNMFLDWSLTPQQDLRTPVSLSKRTGENSLNTGSQKLLKAHVELEEIKERQEADGKYASRTDQSFRHLENMENFSPEAVVIMNQNLDRAGVKAKEIGGKSALIDRRISFSNPGMFVAQNSKSFEPKASQPKNFCQNLNATSLKSNLLCKDATQPKSAIPKTNNANTTSQTNLPAPNLQNPTKLANKPAPALPTPRNTHANPPDLSLASPTPNPNSVSLGSNSKSMEIRMKNVNGKFILTTQTTHLQNPDNQTSQNLTLSQSLSAQIPNTKKTLSKPALGPSLANHKYTAITNNKKRRNGNRKPNANNGNAKHHAKLPKKRIRKRATRTPKHKKETAKVPAPNQFNSMMIRNLHDLPANNNNKESRHLSPIPKHQHKHPLSSTSFQNGQNCPRNMTSTSKPVQITPKPHFDSFNKGHLTQSTKIDDFRTPDAYHMTASALFQKNSGSEGIQPHKRGRRQNRPIGQFEADEMGVDPLNKRTSSFAKRMATPDENAQRGFRGTKRVSRPVFPDTRF